MKIEEIRIGQSLTISPRASNNEWAGLTVQIVGLHLETKRRPENISVLDFEVEYDGFKASDFIAPNTPLELQAERKDKL